MRVFLAEDQYLLRQGLERLLVSQGVEVVVGQTDVIGPPTPE